MGRPQPRTDLPVAPEINCQHLRVKVFGVEIGGNELKHLATLNGTQTLKPRDLSFPDHPRHQKVCKPEDPNT